MRQVKTFVKHSRLPLSILVIYVGFTVASSYGYIPSGLELLEGLRGGIGEQWFWLAVFCIFLEALVVISLYFPGQYIATLLVVLSEPDMSDILLLSLAMVIATTLGSAVNYSIGRYLSAATETKPLRYRTLLPAMIHSSGLAIFTFNWGLNKGTARLIPVSFLLNMPYYLLIILTAVTFGEQIIAATDSPLVIGTALTLWLVISIWLDVKHRRKAA